MNWNRLQLWPVACHLELSRVQGLPSLCEMRNFSPGQKHMLSGGLLFGCSRRSSRALRSLRVHLNPDTVRG